MHYHHILLKNVPQLLTYQTKESIPVGSLVKVSLGRRIVHGIVLSETRAPAFECSEIEEIIISEAISPLQIALCRWMSTYYICSLQKCVQLFIPTVIWNAKMKVKNKDGQLKNPDADQPSKPYHDQPLTAEQKQVLDAIASSSGLSLRVTPVLLHGITGSGKTEIYLQLIKKNIAQGLQTILLVPEIALTTELIQYFAAHFPDQISIIHSKLANGQRLQSWHRIHQGKTKLILGSRSALFTPWKELGAIIIDEEHEWNYKQEQSPRYHAKTVAEHIVGLQNPKPLLILGSATPSIESYYNTIEASEAISYKLLNLPYRATAHPLPPVTVVDLRDEYKKKNFSMFSDTLQEAIKDRLEKKEQIILFLNKRGSSSSVTCRDCGYSPRCPNCDIALTYHSKLKDFQQGGLICHYCGHFEANLSSCPNCKSVAIRHLGSGTQKAEDQLQKLFPTARILRADKDTTTGKYDFEALYHQMKDGHADILLGTQMITKGLDLENVTLTGVLIADIGLHLPDFRASERVFQLLTQVAGRSGRHKPGEVIIQTYQPDHPAITFAKNHDYSGFYDYEIAIREQFLYPPFSKIVKLIYAHENPKKAEEEAQKLYSQMSHVTGQWSQVTLSPNYIPRLHSKYVWNIFIRGKNPRELLEGMSIPNGWKVDIDPR
jgi:primosomal protein N' (replication factor Y)